MLELRRARVTSLPESISRLTALQELDISGNPDLALPPGLTACRQLTMLHIECDSASPVLASLQSLRHLVVGWPTDQQLDETYWAQLTGLTGLVLDWSSEWDGADGDVPTVLGGMAGLRNLSLVNATIDDMPDGTYLNSLEELYMSGCTFQSGVPEALASATQLRSLEMPYCEGIELALGDTVVLMSLPLLKTLVLPWQDDESQCVRDKRLAQLLALWRAVGRSPPEICYG